MRRRLFSILLCGLLIKGTQATDPLANENTSINSTSLPQNLKAIADAKVYNEDYALMSLTLDPLQQVCQILAENDCASSITSLGQVSIHLAARILRRMGEYNNPNSRHAIRVDLRKAIKAREACIPSQTPKWEEEKAPFLTPWRVLLGEDDSLRTLTWANDMLSPKNVARLRKNGLLEQLTEMDDQQKAFALAAGAVQIFMDDMTRWHQECIIATALNSSCPLSEYAARGAACRKHFFMGGMDAIDQATLIKTVLESSCPLSEYAARGAACREHLFTTWLSGWNQTLIILYVLPLSNTQMDQLVRECSARPQDDGNRTTFIQDRAGELREGK